MKPYLYQPVLFARNLPRNATIATLEQLLNDFAFSRIILNYGAPEISEKDSGHWRKRRSSREAQTARIEFVNIAEAEKAYAIVNTRRIPGSHPKTPLFLLMNVEATSPMMDACFGGYPRLVKLLQPTITDIELYTMIRPYGAPAFVHVDSSVGCVVQFWTEDDAKAAADALRAAFARSLKLTLQAYDPCSIFCRNLHYDINAVSLKEYFSGCGTVTNAEILYQKNGKSKGQGLISFQNADEASYAIRRYNGIAWKSKPVALRYQEVTEEWEPTATVEDIAAPSVPLTTKNDTASQEIPSSNTSPIREDSELSSEKSSSASVKESTFSVTSNAIEDEAPHMASETAGSVDVQEPSKTSANFEKSSSETASGAINHDDDVPSLADIIGGTATMGPIPANAHVSSPSASDRTKEAVGCGSQAASFPNAQDLPVEATSSVHEHHTTSSASPSTDLPHSTHTASEGQQLIIDALLTEITTKNKELLIQKAKYETEANTTKRAFEGLQRENKRSMGLISAIVETLKGMAAETWNSEVDPEIQVLMQNLFDFQKASVGLEELRTTIIIQHLQSIWAARTTLAMRLKHLPKETPKPNHTNSTGDGRLRERLDSTMEMKEMLEEQLENAKSSRDDWIKKFNSILIAKAEAEKTLQTKTRSLDARIISLDREKSILEGRLKQMEFDRVQGWASKECSDRVHNVELQAQLRNIEKEKELLVELVTRSKKDIQDKQAGWEQLEARYKNDCDHWRNRFEMAESHREMLEIEIEADRPLLEEARRMREKQKKKAEMARREAEVKEAARRMKEMTDQENWRKEMKEAAELEELRQRYERQAELAREKARREKVEAAAARERERARRKREEARLKREEEARRKEAEERAKERAREQAWRTATVEEYDRCRKRDVFLCQDWSVYVAIHRFETIVDDFENTKFSEAKPLTFSNIPWPIFDNPLSPSFGPQLLTWEKVEKFFACVKKTSKSSTSEYNKLVRRVHLLFHPDKWRSLAILNSVYDQDVRNAIEEAGNIVAQAMTPIWTKTKTKSSN